MQEKIDYILQNFERLHQAFYNKPNVNRRGPAFYFSQRAIQEQNDIFRKCEYLYALLPLWGMDKNFGPKIKSFEEVYENVQCIMEIINEFDEAVTLENIAEEHCSLLKKAFLKLNVMQTNSKLVANSKVLAHLLPKIVPPMDRAHTIGFLELNIHNNLERQADLFIRILRDFYQPISINQQIRLQFNQWSANIHIYFWDTSIPKIIDNLVFAVN